jgi:hypothetical protein
VTARRTAPWRKLDPDSRKEAAVAALASGRRAFILIELLVVIAIEDD